MQRMGMIIAGAAAVFLGLSLTSPSASSATCITDAEIETAVGEQVRSGAFAVRTDMLGNRPLCSGLPMAEAIQRLRARHFSQQAPQRDPVSRPANPSAHSATATSAAPSGNVPQSALTRYVGKYAHDKVGSYTFPQHPALIAALTKAGVTAATRRELRDYAVSSPIENKGGIIVDSGCFPHHCSEMHYKIYVNPRSGMAALCHFDTGAKWYSAASPSRQLTSTAPCPEEPGAAPAEVRESLMGAGASLPVSEAPAGEGRISGTFSYPSDYVPDDIQACAENLATRRETCVRRSHVERGEYYYSIYVPPGRYHVYARSADMPRKKAYYSRAVPCGLEAKCRDHTPIVVTVTSGSSQTNVYPHDWYANP